MTQTPVVLCFSGHDPSGGAGIQADIETLHRLGCHAATVVTALTLQDTRNVVAVLPQPADDFAAQARLIMADLPIAAVKIGLLGSAALARACAGLIRELPGVPVVLDPILAAGGGTEMAGEELIEAICEDLLPLTTLLTPNSVEARRLTGFDLLDRCADNLLAKGCGNVLITGTHENAERVVNRLYQIDQNSSWGWDRLPYSYHGSGCTLASATAGFLALGQPLVEAVYRAQHFTWCALMEGKAIGYGQHLPNRAVSLKTVLPAYR